MSQKEHPDCSPDNIWPVGKKTAIITTIIAFGLGLFDFIDRQVLASVLPFIKEEWALTDAQSGMLISAVNIAIAVILIPSAYFVDRWSRKKMIALCATVWSIATGFGALTTRFTQLLICRFVLGIGEAIYLPAAIPLLAAVYPKKLRTVAASIVVTGTLIGIPLGVMLGAYIATHYGWRNAFLFVMVPGLVLAACTVFLKDYKTVKDKNATSPYLVVIKEIVQIPSMIYIILGAICFYFFHGTQINWLPSYFHRIGNIPITEASVYASIIALGYIVGTACSGFIIDYIKHYFPHITPIIIAICLFIAFLCFGSAYYFIEPSSTLQISLLVIGNFFFSFIFAGYYSCIMAVTATNIYATSLSIVTLLQNLLGFAMGPLVTGILADYFGLTTAIQIVVFAVVLSSFCFLRCGFLIKEDSEKVGCQEFNF